MKDTQLKADNSTTQRFVTMVLAVNNGDWQLLSVFFNVVTAFDAKTLLYFFHLKLVIKYVLI